MDIKQTISKVLALISSLKKTFPRGVAGDQALEMFDFVLDQDPVKALEQCENWIIDRMMEVRVNIEAKSGQTVRHWVSLLNPLQSFPELLIKVLQLTHLLPREIIGVQNGVTFDCFDFFKQPLRFVGKGKQTIRFSIQPFPVSTTIWFDPEILMNIFHDRKLPTHFTHTTQVPYIIRQEDDAPLPLVFWQVSTNPSLLQNHCSDDIQKYLQSYVDSFLLLYPRQPIPIAIKYSVFDTFDNLPPAVSAFSQFVRSFLFTEFSDMIPVSFQDNSDNQASQQKLDHIFRWLRPSSNEWFDRSSIPVALKNAMFDFYKNNAPDITGRSVGSVIIREGESFQWTSTDSMHHHLKKFLGNCAQMKVSPKVDQSTTFNEISTNSHNGTVFQMVNQNGDEDEKREIFIGKVVQSQTSDNPVYEYVNGVAVNELRKQWPFFVGTYDLYQKNDQGWQLVTDPSSLVSSDSTKFLVTSEYLYTIPNERSMADVRDSIRDSENQLIPSYVANTILIHTCITELANRFLHQDHHDGNVMLIPVGENNDDYVEVLVPGLAVAIRTSHWPVLIDFGRSYLISESESSLSTSQKMLRQVDNLDCAPDGCLHLGFTGIIKDRNTQVYPQVYQKLPLLTVGRWWSEDANDKYLLAFLGLYRRIPETTLLDESNLFLSQDPTYTSLQARRS